MIKCNSYINCTILIINIHIPFNHKNYISLTNSILIVSIYSHDIQLSKYARIIDFPHVFPKICHHYVSLILLLLFLLLLFIINVIQSKHVFVYVCVWCVHTAPVCNEKKRAIWHARKKQLKIKMQTKIKIQSP